MTTVTPLRVGLDLGTSGLKAVVLDAGGRVVAEARATYPTARPEPGASEQDPATWTAAAGRVLRELAEATEVSSWVGIGLSGMMPTLVTVDAAGQALGPAITWEDARADADGELLADAVGRDELYALTGQRLDGRYLLPMFLRVARVDPSRAAATTMLLSAKDHLFRWLTGELRTDPSTAAGYGAFDLQAGAWDAGVLKAAGVLAAEHGAALPALPAIAAATGQWPLDATVAHELGLPAGLPISVGGADSVLGALGLGVVAPGEVAYLSGTSTVILAVSASPRTDRAQRYLVTPLAGTDGWGLEMDLLASGSSLRWLADLVGVDVGDLVAEARHVAPLDGPVFLPYLAPGEQGALWDSTLTGSVTGLTLQHDRRHLARGLLNGLVLESRRCLEVLAEVTGSGEVRIGGGGTQDTALAADLADASGRRVRHATTEGHDHSAVGAALLVPGARAAAAPDAVVDPRPEVRPVWDELWARHEDALRALRQLGGGRP